MGHHRPPTQPPPLPGQAASGSRIEWDDLVTGKNLFRIGLALLLLSLGFLFRYGWQQGWITPVAQILAASTASTAAIALGDRMRDARSVFGHMLQGGGVAGLYLTAYAAHQAFAMTDGPSALAQLAVVAAVGVALALRRDSRVLAGVGLGGALLAPVLVGGNVAGPVGDVVFASVVVATGVGLSLRKAWPEIYGVAALGAFAIAALDLAEASLSSSGAWGIGFLVFSYLSLAAVVPAVAITGRRVDATVLAASAIVPLVVGFFAAIQFGGPMWLLGVIAYLLAATHLGAYRALAEASGGELQLIPASLLPVAGTAALFDGSLTVLSAAMVGAAVVTVGLSRQRPTYVEIGGVLYGVAGAVALAMSTWDVATPSSLGTIMARFGVFVVAAAAALQLRRRSGHPTAIAAWGATAMAGSLWLVLTELSAHNLGLVSAAWGLLGVGAVVYGHRLRLRGPLIAGLGTIGLTLVKLFMVDLAMVEPVWRIALFAGLGALLLGLGYWMSQDPSR